MWEMCVCVCLKDADRDEPDGAVHQVVFVFSSLVALRWRKVTVCRMTLSSSPMVRTESAFTVSVLGGCQRV